MYIGACGAKSCASHPPSEGLNAALDGGTGFGLGAAPVQSLGHQSRSPPSSSFQRLRVSHSGSASGLVPSRGDQFGTFGEKHPPESHASMYRDASVCPPTPMDTGPGSGSGSDALKFSYVSSPSTYIRSVELARKYENSTRVDSPFQTHCFFPTCLVKASLEFEQSR